MNDEKNSEKEIVISSFFIVGKFCKRYLKDGEKIEKCLN